MRFSVIAGAAVLLLAAAPGRPVRAQQTPPAARPDTTRPAPDTAGAAAARPDTTRRDSLRVRISPGKAFYRSLLIPGWGQISAGAYKRAAVFITLQGASDFMLVKTIRKLNVARTQLDAYFTLSADSLKRITTDTALQRKYQNPDSLRAALFASGGIIGDTTKNPKYTVVKSRKKQREDWITLAVFWTLASSADAFVNAQLSDFPAEVGAEPRPGGGMILWVALPARKFW